MAAWVVFMRGVNVGGHKTFRPSALARELADLDVINVGAAGTFVVRRAVSEAKLRATLLQGLQFETQLMICPARDLVCLVEQEGDHGGSLPRGVRRYVSILEQPPRKFPRLPISRPEGAKWELKIIGVSGRFALSLARPLGSALIYPNEVVEKTFGMPATTRGWDTISKIRGILG